MTTTSKELKEEIKQILINHDNAEYVAGGYTFDQCVGDILSLFKTHMLEEEFALLNNLLELINKGNDAKSLIEMQLQSGKYIDQTKS